MGGNVDTSSPNLFGAKRLVEHSRHGKREIAHIIAMSHFPTFDSRISFPLLGDLLWLVSAATFMRTFAMIAAVGLSQASLAGSTIGLNFCDRYNDPRVSDGVCDGFSGWTDSRASGDTTNAAVQSTPLALGTSGVTATWTASNSWAGGSQTNNEVALYRVYLDDGQTSTGIGVRVTIAGLAGWMSANGCSSYQIRCYASSDFAASFRPISIRSGSLTTSPVVHTMTPAILGGSDFPTNLTMPTLPAVARGYVDSPDTLTDDTITLTIPNRSGTSRGTLCAFKITGTVGSIAGGAALFANPTYVDTTGEMQVTRTALLNLGLPVRTFTGITATDWNNAFAADFVVIPELEKLGLNLTSDAIAARVAVEHGGSLLLAKSVPPPPCPDDGNQLASLARAGWVDEHFPVAAGSLSTIEWAAPDLS